MDGLARITGDWYRPIEVAGRTYRLVQPRLRDLAALEAEILARQPDPLEQAARAAAHVPANQARAFWDAAFAAARKARSLSLEDLDQLPEATRAAASAFLLLRRHHSDEIQSLDDAMAWCERAAAEHGTGLQAILAAVREPDEPDEPREKKRPDPSPARPAGESCSAAAPSDSAGRPPSSPS